MSVTQAKRPQKATEPTTAIVQAPARFGTPRQIASITAIAIGFFALVTLLLTVFIQETKLPSEWYLPLGPAIAGITDAFIANFQWLYAPIASIIEVAFADLVFYMQLIPAPILTALLISLVYLVSGWRLGAFAAISLIWVVAASLWTPMLETLALMVIAV